MTGMFPTINDISGGYLPRRRRATTTPLGDMYPGVGETATAAPRAASAPPQPQMPPTRTPGTPFSWQEAAQMNRAVELGGEAKRLSMLPAISAPRTPYLPNDASGADIGAVGAPSAPGDAATREAATQNAGRAGLIARNSAKANMLSGNYFTQTGIVEDANARTNAMLPYQQNESAARAGWMDAGGDQMGQLQKQLADQQKLNEGLRKELSGYGWKNQAKADQATAATAQQTSKDATAAAGFASKEKTATEATASKERISTATQASKDKTAADTLRSKNFSTRMGTYLTQRATAEKAKNWTEVTRIDARIADLDKQLDATQGMLPGDAGAQAPGYETPGLPGGYERTSTAPAPAATTQPIRVSTVEEARLLKPGTPFIGGDGKPYIR